MHYKDDNDTTKGTISLLQTIVQQSYQFETEIEIVTASRTYRLRPIESTGYNPILIAHESGGHTDLDLQHAWLEMLTAVATPPPKKPRQKNQKPSAKRIRKSVSLKQVVDAIEEGHEPDPSTMEMLWNQTDANQVSQSALPAEHCAISLNLLAVDVRNQDGVLDKAELKALVVGSAKFMQEKVEADKQAAMKDLNGELAKAAEDPMMGAMAEVMLEPMIAMIEATLDEALKVLAETIKNPRPRVDELEQSLDINEDGKITKSEFVTNGAEVIFKPTFSLAPGSLERVLESAMCGFVPMAAMAAMGDDDDCNIM